MLGGDVDDLVSKNDVMVSAWNEALVEAWKSSNNINSEEYIQQHEQIKKARVNSENKLFWGGMPVMLQKKYEKIAENVKLRRYCHQNSYHEDYWKMAMLLYKWLKA